MATLRDTTIYDNLNIENDLVVGGVTVKGNVNFNRTIFNNIPVFKHGMGWYG